MTEKRWLALILILFVLLGVIYAVVTPAFEASDELWHYPMVRHLADGNPLPIQVFDPALAGPWKQEASQPPLYYYLGAALTFWIDTSDMTEVRRENPHVDNGLITEDGNINLVVHDPMANPWQGTLLAVRLVRLLSVFMGTVTVYLTYRIAGASLPGRPEIALGAAAVNAFMPMFLFISGAVNNDNLAIMLASLALFLMITLVTRAQSNDLESEGTRTWRQVAVWLTLGVVIGSALLTKEGTLGLIPLAWGTCLIASWLEHPSGAGAMSFGVTIRWLMTIVLRSLGYFALVILPVALIAGWWYWRNVALYGDWLGWNAFIAVLGQRAHPASLLQLWGERRGFLMAYWGLFGGVNVPMPSWVYTIMNTLLFLAVIGFLYLAFGMIRDWLFVTRGQWRSLRGFVNNLLGFVAEHFALFAALLFSIAVVFGLVRWATTTWSSQGRLVFTAISSLTTLFVVGLAGWMPRSAARWTSGIIGLFYLLIAGAAPLLWIRPAYQPESYHFAQDVRLQEVDAVFGNQLRLRGASIAAGDSGTAVSKPGEGFWVYLDWEVLEPTARDWSVFVHAVDPVLGRPISQRDMYPGQGLILTSWLDPGQRLTNAYYVQLPETAVAPAELEIVAGLYDVTNGERLHITAGGDHIRLGTLSLQSVGGEYPNQTSVNFEDKFELVGFKVEPRSAAASETIELTLYWQPLKVVDQDYTFFAQVVDEDTTRWASVDLAPPLGTSNWPAGETQVLPMSLSLAPETPAEIYPVMIGVYTQDAQGDFNRLQIKAPDGRLTDDFLELTRIRVE